MKEHLEKRKRERQGSAGQVHQSAAEQVKIQPVEILGKDWLNEERR